MLKTDYKFGEVYAMSEMFAPEGSKVNAKPLWGNDNGGVMLLTFAPGQKLDEHVAPAEVMVCVAQGSIDFFMQGKVHHITAGNFMLVGKGVPHSVASSQGAKVMLMKVKSEE